MLSEAMDSTSWSKAKLLAHRLVSLHNREVDGSWFAVQGGLTVEDRAPEGQEGQVHAVLPGVPRRTPAGLALVPTGRALVGEAGLARLWAVQGQLPAELPRVLRVEPPVHREIIQKNCLQLVKVWTDRTRAA